MMERILMNDKLNRIAHLPTSFTFDHNKILEEVTNLPMEMSPFQSGLRYGKLMTDIHYKLNWVSTALYSIDGSTKSDPEEPWTGDFIPTEAIKLCPYTDSIIKQLGGGKLLARLDNILPHSSVGWHGHQGEARQPPWISVYQLPLSIPRQAKYSVLNSMDYRLSDFSSPIPQYDLSYEEGRLYVFNSYHYHNAFNDSDEPMLFIRFYVDIRDSSVEEFLRKELSSYSGELMASYEEYMEKGFYGEPK